MCDKGAPLSARMTICHMTTSADDPFAPLETADPARSFVIAQLGQSLDGRIATLSGESRWINGSAALDHVHQLRARVDAVVVGVGTALADDPQLNVRRCPGRNPARVVIDPGGRLPASARLLASDGARRILVRACDGDTPAGVEIVRVTRNADGYLAPAEIVARLAALGFRKLLIEGGASTVSQFIDAGVIDRLHVLVAPLLIGSGKAGLALRPVAALCEARRPRTRVHVLADGDVLFDCDLTSTA